MLRLHQLAQIDVVNAPEQVRRLGGRQSISLQLRPNNALALEEVVAIIDNEILPDIRGEAMQQGVSIKLEGAASALDQTWRAMQGNVITAIFVIFLLLVILLRSFVLPFYHPINNTSGGGRRDRWACRSQYIYPTAIGYADHAGVCYFDRCGGEQCHFDD